MKKTFEEIKAQDKEYIMNTYGRFDVAFVDTWRDASDGAPMYKKMKALEKHSPNTSFLYWVEGFLRSRLRAEKICDYIEAYEDGVLEEDYSTVEENLKKI